MIHGDNCLRLRKTSCNFRTKELKILFDNSNPSRINICVFYVGIETPIPVKTTLSMYCLTLNRKSANLSISVIACNNLVDVYSDYIF